VGSVGNVGEPRTAERRLRCLRRIKSLKGQNNSITKQRVWISHNQRTPKLPGGFALHVYQRSPWCLCSGLLGWVTSGGVGQSRKQAEDLLSVPHELAGRYRCGVVYSTPRWSFTSIILVSVLGALTSSSYQPFNLTSISYLSSYSRIFNVSKTRTWIPSVFLGSSGSTRTPKARKCTD
jgi:hypothetical protein